MKKKIVSFVLVFAMIAALCVFLTACGSGTSIDLNEYMSIDISGYDGYGTADTCLDYEGFEKDYGDKIKYTTEGESVFSYILSPSEALLSCFANAGYLSETSGLSNGDEITLAWDITAADEERVKACFDVTLKYDDITETVEGLSDVETFDAFEDVSITFSGTQPNGTAIMTSDGVLSVSEMTIEPSTGLSNGDVVTVSLDNEDMDYYIENCGAVPAEMSREYTVEGLPYYVNALSQIPESGLNEMDEQARDAMYARVSQMTNAEYQDITNIELLGCYLLTPKDGFDTKTANEIYLVYHVDTALHNKDANGNVYNTPFSFYRYYEFTNGIILADGTFSIDYSDYSIPTAEVIATAYDYTERFEWYEDKDLMYYGYDNLDTLFNNVVTQNIETYNYESSVNTDGN